MRLFIAREALDEHLQVAGDVVMPGKCRSASGSRGWCAPALFYGWWYPTAGSAGAAGRSTREFGPLADAPALRRAHLAPARAPAVPPHGAASARRSRSARRCCSAASTSAPSCSPWPRPARRAAAAAAQDDPRPGTCRALADVFCRQARARVSNKFQGLWRNADVATYRVAQEVLAGEHGGWKRAWWTAKPLVKLSDGNLITGNLPSGNLSPPGARS